MFNRQEVGEGAGLSLKRIKGIKAEINGAISEE